MAGDEAVRQKPLEIAPETFVIRGLTPSVGGSWTNLNAMLIRRREPIAMDCGIGTLRESWFEDLFALVEPEDLRWVFVTHNDCDHADNLVETLARCPNAKVVTSSGESYRLMAQFGLPFERLRLVDSGQAFEVGGRSLLAMRPPVYDSPYTRGVFDATSGVYYAADAFCAPMPERPVDFVDEIDGEAWADGFARFHHTALCPWVALADRERFAGEVARLAALDIRQIVSAHSPVIAGGSVARALALMTALPDAAPAPLDLAGFVAG